MDVEPVGLAIGETIRNDLESFAHGIVWFSQTSISLINWELPFFLRFPFGHIVSALLAALFASFRSRAALQLEILALRHQVCVLQLWVVKTPSPQETNSFRRAIYLHSGRVNFSTGAVVNRSLDVAALANKVIDLIQ